MAYYDEADELDYSDSTLPGTTPPPPHRPDSVELTATMAKEKTAKSSAAGKRKADDQEEVSPEVSHISNAKKHKSTKNSDPTESAAHAEEAADSLSALESSLAQLENTTNATTSAAVAPQSQDLKKEVKKMHSDKLYLLPFATPLIEKRNEFFLLRTVWIAERMKRVKRGVKEVVKALRKIEAERKAAGKPTPGYDNPSWEEMNPYLVIFAGDVWPMDVISHIPCHCEEVVVDYVYTRSRILLGLVGATKRATSVVLLQKFRDPKKSNHDDQKAKDPVVQKDDKDDKKGKRPKDFKSVRDYELDDPASVAEWEKQFDTFAAHLRRLRAKIQM